MASGIVLSVDVREGTGSGAARALRREEKVPGVLYGGALGPVSISVGRKELVKALRSGKFLSHMVTLDHKGDRQPVIPKAIQLHPVTELPIHIDLYRVDEASVIDVDVPVHFKNHEASPGLKKGGTLNVVVHTLRLKVPAGQIPEEVVVDLTGLEMGAVVHVSSITLPAGCEAHMKEADATIASIGGNRAVIEGDETPAS